MNIKPTLQTSVRFSGMLARRSSMIDTGIPLPNFGDGFLDMDLDSSETPQTPPPTFCSPQSSFGSQNIITPEQLASFITDPKAAGYDQLIIMDARFDYEFRGGRIVGAINVKSRAQLIGIYNRYKDQNVCVVIHCEFSQNRGPSLYQIFREHDRNHNTYPNLSFPNVFLLEGGYRRFFQEMPQFCIGGYIPMRDERYVNSGELRRSHSFFKKQILQRKSLRPRPNIQRCNSQTLQHLPLLLETSSSMLLNSTAFDDEAASFPIYSSQ